MKVIQPSYKRSVIKKSIYSIGINALHLTKFNSGRLPISKIYKKLIYVGFANVCRRHNKPKFRKEKVNCSQYLQTQTGSFWQNLSYAINFCRWKGNKYQNQFDCATLKKHSPFPLNFVEMKLLLIKSIA